MPLPERDSLSHTVPLIAQKPKEGDQQQRLLQQAIQEIDLNWQPSEPKPENENLSHILFCVYNQKGLDTYWPQLRNLEDPVLPLQAIYNLMLTQV